MAVVAWTALAIALFVWIPHQKRNLDDFGLAPPWLTQQVIEFTFLVSRYSFIAIPALVLTLGILAALFVMARHKARAPILAAFLALLIVGTPILGLAFVGSTIGLGEAKLAEALSK
ncbi:MAG: hypothetical protein U0746_00675 [Gemmataceae bacterium]